jgi:hypothetical protein
MEQLTITTACQTTANHASKHHASQKAGDAAETKCCTPPATHTSNHSCKAMHMQGSKHVASHSLHQPLIPTAKLFGINQVTFNKQQLPRNKTPMTIMFDWNRAVSDDATKQHKLAPQQILSRHRNWLHHVQHATVHSSTKARGLHLHITYKLKTLPMPITPSAVLWTEQLPVQGQHTQRRIIRLQYLHSPGAASYSIRHLAADAADV